MCGACRRGRGEDRRGGEGKGGEGGTHKCRPSDQKELLDMVHTYTHTTQTQHKTQANNTDAECKTREKGWRKLEAGSVLDGTRYKDKAKNGDADPGGKTQDGKTTT